mmetsp:Transcript_17171/g.30106  ORF Transcript_17171/g.30106 Transcript_17171/m.30106 type:complete len:223 (+) Transcript_17171:29-697(+)|eukprot:CAMPEP_0197626760 /NCGR_PEP_ID=MMETSP1338-20131121/5578_1 /TAXON_ID=43686 ORGANISM="Pelagodinium beii, Strain RCC1491" /NCGR_SAMPLE_ID=MMETSP1338 /ASSEMBLY_ACC=CAM_ASM_000754 /LENGTH=222 /DNA_ID=CAMNT_0043197317 /DNA_START=29 /DNA_END=697 /DNA_ORIENTATION=+
MGSACSVSQKHPSDYDDYETPRTLAVAGSRFAPEHANESMAQGLRKHGEPEIEKKDGKPGWSLNAKFALAMAVLAFGALAVTIPLYIRQESLQATCFVVSVLDRQVGESTLNRACDYTLLTSVTGNVSWTLSSPKHGYTCDYFGTDCNYAIPKDCQGSCSIDSTGDEQRVSFSSGIDWIVVFYTGLVLESTLAVCSVFFFLMFRQFPRLDLIGQSDYNRVAA